MIFRIDSISIPENPKFLILYFRDKSVRLSLFFEKINVVASIGFVSEKRLKSGHWLTWL